VTCYLHTYKIVFGLTDVVASDMFTLTTQFFFCTILKLEVMPTNFIRIIVVLMYVYKFFFSERVIAPWNNLSATSEHFSSLSSFKYLINSTDFSMYMSRSVFKF